jgi:hypothetical protein
MSAAGKLFFKTDLTDELHFGVRTKAIGYVPCYKLAAFIGFQFYDKCFRRLAYNREVFAQYKVATATEDMKCSIF